MATKTLPVSMLIPTVSFWNKEYRSKSYGQELVNVFVSTIRSVASILNNQHIENLPRDNFLFSDDLMVVFRNLGFLKDKLFAEALGDVANDTVLMGRIWRIWFISWSLSTKWTGSGAICDFGTYNGKAINVACRYSRLLHGEDLSLDSSKDIYLADCFDNPPQEALKSDHSPDLDKSVRLLFEAYTNARIIKGFLPDSIKPYDFSRGIDWCQIDLNSSRFDTDTFSHIYKYLNKGAHVVFDDYGFSRYNDTQLALDKFLEDKPESIFESPTGQGFLIKI